MSRTHGIVLLMAVALGAWTTQPLHAAAPECEAEPLPPVLTLDTAVRWALFHNPELAAIRQQHGIAAAGIVIARTYPFNPGYEGRVRYASGSEATGTTNVVPSEHWLFLELEVRHQRQFREEVASAALTRTDWEIAFQEVDVMVRTLRAFATVLYRRDKLQLAEETVRLNEETAHVVKRLVEQAQARPADLILAQTEVEAARSLLNPARLSLTVAENDLRRLLGLVDGPLPVQGTLELPSPPIAGVDLTALALEGRADLHARSAAIAEAEANVRLMCADRYGNPVVGPSYELDNTNVSYIGVQVHVPLPVLNTKTGEILQREAERTRAALLLRQTEVQVRQDVENALARLTQAQSWVESYRGATVPRLSKALDEMNHLFTHNEPGSDLLRVIEVRRQLLRARDAYLDALAEMSQAEADLAAALGDPRFLLPPGYNVPEAGCVKSP
jgi:outer membrane protein TolC